LSYSSALISFSIKHGFQTGLQDFMRENKSLKAVLMGTRKNDPHTGLIKFKSWLENMEIISTSDKNYPPILRINPILYWSYEQVWTFIKKFEIPYCSLYNLGFVQSLLMNF
jgi:FAD synthetase